MKMLCAIISLLAIVLVSLPAAAQVLDAPTGTYKGTLVHERRLTLKQTDPPRVIPPRAFRDAGLDNGLTLDFTPTPPEIKILDGSSPVTVLFPTITVDGNVVTVQAFISFSTADFESADISTLTLKRSKP